MLEQDNLVTQTNCSSDWFIEDILPSQGRTLLYALSASNVYRLMIDWAFSIAAGQAWLHKDTKAQKVLCITNQRELKRIALAWSQEYNRAVEDNLIFTSSPFQPTYKYTKGRRILHKIQNTQPSIVILDSRISIGIDNYMHVQRFTEDFLSICTEIQYTYHIPILVVHHDKPNAGALQLLKDTSDTILQLYKSGNAMYLKREKPSESQQDIVQFMFNRQATPVI